MLWIVLLRDIVCKLPPHCWTAALRKLSRTTQPKHSLITLILIVKVCLLKYYVKVAEIQAYLPIHGRAVNVVSRYIRSNTLMYLLQN